VHGPARRGRASARIEPAWSGPVGEAKDIRLEPADGSTDGTDKLSGHAEFTPSLDHECVDGLAHFADVVRGRLDDWPDGLAPLRLRAAAGRPERAALVGGAR
jgi:hypothetical protein